MGMHTNMLTRRRLFRILLLGLVFPGLAGCQKTPPAPAKTIFALGTVCSLNLYNEGTGALYEQLISRLYEIEQAFNVNLPDSEVSRINQNAGIAPVQASGEVLALLDKACYFAKKTNGAFDPSIGPLVQLWGIATDNPRIPAQEELDACLPLVDYRKIEYDLNAQTVFLPQPGMRLDLGGIAKGYAADELIKIIRDAKVRRAVIDLGGNVYVYGAKPDGTLWRVGVKNPVDPEGEPVVRLDIGSNTVVTSGMYERFFEQDGIRYHHILNPQTGYPAYSGIRSATIVSASSLAADALSTSVFVLGKEQAAALFAQGFQDGGFSADMLIIEEDGRITVTENLKSAVTVLLPEYQLVPDLPR
jgi:thiamine biosynthesis lipoprotein